MTERTLGLKVEREHSKTIKAIIADAKAGKLKSLEFYIGMFADDHLDEIKDYYTRLMKMEKDAKKDEKHEAAETPKEEVAEHKDGKDEEEEAQKRSDAAFKSLAEKPLGSPVESGKDPEPYYPEVSISFDGGNEYKVGDEAELTFKVKVRSVSEDKEGHRVSFKLLGIKE